MDVEDAISIQLISHWSITRMMCPVRHAKQDKKGFEFPISCYISLKNP